MALFFFVLALVLLVVALVLLRLDARQKQRVAERRGGGALDSGPHDDADRLGASGPVGAGTGGVGEPGDDDEAHTPTPEPTPGDAATTSPEAAVADDPAQAAGSADRASGEAAQGPGQADQAPGQADRAPGQADHSPAAAMGVPQPAPFQRGAEVDRAQDERAQDERAQVEPRAGEPGAGEPGAGPVADQASNAADHDSTSADDPVGDEAPADQAETADESGHGANAGTAAAAGAGAGAAGAVGAGAAAVAAPSLMDRVRSLLPGRRSATADGAATSDGAAVSEQGDHDEQADPLADSPVVRWLEEREFEPTPTPAPDFRHGDFAGGLPALGTVSHGVFRGRRAIMGVTGGRTVLALRRDTASDVVLDLSRADVDAEPGFHDAGEVGALEARTSDVGRLDLVDRGRLADAVRDLPGDVRRVWAEDEWIAATVDGADDPSTWDDVVVALHGAADMLAPLPPVGGRARPLPTEIDPGAPGAADGPDADPAVGMDGEQGTGPGAESRTPADDTPSAARTGTMAAIGGAAAGAAAAGAATSATGGDEPAVSTSDEAAGPRRAGHLRLVPGQRDGVRDLTDGPVVADRGDAETPEASYAAEPSTPSKSADAEAETEPAGSTTDSAGSASESDAPATEQEPEPEPDPFAEIMEPAGPVASRGDVAADHLEPRPPLARPTRGAGQAFPEDASVPPLAAGAATGEAGIKPLGSEDDADEIRSEVERFDAARTDGGSDLDEAPSGRHGADGVEGDDSDAETAGLSVAELAARLGANPSGGRRHRRRRAEDTDPADAEQDTDTDTDTDTGQVEQTAEDSGRSDHRERPGVDPDVEETASLRLPPDIRD